MNNIVNHSMLLSVNIIVTKAESETERVQRIFVYSALIKALHSRNNSNFYIIINILI